jgi:hypothetical protein
MALEGVKVEDGLMGVTIMNGVIVGFVTGTHFCDSCQDSSARAAR